MKDSVSTGWSKTFEYIFGRLDEAKDFFTALTEGELAQVIYNIGEYRNAILGVWSMKDAEGLSSGGKVLRDAILNITDALGTLFKTLLMVLPGMNEIYGEGENGEETLENIGRRLYEMTLDFRAFTDRVKEASENFYIFMHTPISEGGPTRIELIRQALSNLASVFGIVAKTIGVVSRVAGKLLFALSPIFDGIGVFIEKLTEPLAALNNNEKVFNDFENSANNISKILDPISKVLGQIVGFLGEVAKFIAQMAIDTFTSNLEFFADVLGIITELFTGNSSQLEQGEGVLERIGKDFEAIKTACTDGLNALKEFFGALIGDIRKLFGLSEVKESDQNGGIFSGIVEFFNTNEFVKKVKEWIDKAIIDIGNFIVSIPSRIKQLGVNIYTTIRKRRGISR